MPLVAGGFVLKLAGSNHGSERVRACEDLLIEGVATDFGGGRVLEIFASGDDLIAPLLHVVEIVGEQLKCGTIRGSNSGYGRLAESVIGTPSEH